MNVLVIAPHPDDEAIGCGGTICLHRERGDRVTAVFLTSGELGLKHLPCEEARRTREREAEEAADILGLKDLTFLRRRDWFVGEEVEETASALRPVLQREAAGLIYVPHESEWHPDHQVTLKVLQMALSMTDNSRPAALAYEIWTPLSEYHHVEDVTAAMTRKLRAIRCYRSQLKGFRYDRAIRGLNQYRGVLAARTRYAEVFADAAWELDR
jgi:LmbE family N-acetylglucosaminyl deacetylase